MKPPHDPRTARLKRWLIAAAILYLLLPRDLIPDFLGRGLGLVDDVAVIAGLVWLYRSRLRALGERRARGTVGPHGHRRSCGTAESLASRSGEGAA